MILICVVVDKIIAKVICFFLLIVGVVDGVVITFVLIVGVIVNGVVIPILFIFDVFHILINIQSIPLTMIYTFITSRFCDTVSSKTCFKLRSKIRCGLAQWAKREKNRQGKKRKKGS